MSTYTMLNPSGRAVELSEVDLIILAMRGAFSGYQFVDTIPSEIFSAAASAANLPGNAARLIEAANRTKAQNSTGIESELAVERAKSRALEARIRELDPNAVIESDSLQEAVERSMISFAPEQPSPDQGEETEAGAAALIDDESDDLGGPVPVTEVSTAGYRGSATRKK